MLITNEDRKAVEEVQAVLLSMEKGKPIFFNQAVYTKKGLVYSTKIRGTDVYGNPCVLGHKWHLTDKGKQMLNLVL